MSSAGAVRAGRAYVELGLQDRLQKGLDAAQAKLKAFGAAATSIGKGLMAGGAAISDPLTAAAAAYMEVGSALEHAAAKTGASVEALSTLGYAAQQSGVDMEGLEKGMTKMQKALAQAEGGSKKAREAFGALGINIEDLKGMSPDEQFKAIADRLSQVTDQNQRAAAAFSIFGKAGTDLLPLLDQGGAGIDQMQARARALGLEMSGETAKGATGFKRALQDLEDVSKMLTVTIGSAVAPAVQQFAQRATRIIGLVMQWSKGHQDLIATIRKVAVGVTAAGAALVVLGTAISLMAPAVGAIAAVVGALAAPVTIVAAAVVGIGAAFAYAVGSGDTFAQRIMSGLGKVAEFLDAALGSWDGFTTSMAALWQQLKPRLLNVWLDIKGALIGIWDSLKSNFPDIVYGWGSAMAEFALKAWQVMSDLVSRIVGLWHKVTNAVDDALFTHGARGAVEADADKNYRGKTLAHGDARAYMQQIDAAEYQAAYKRVADEAHGDKATEAALYKKYVAPIDARHEAAINALTGKTLTEEQIQAMIRARMDEIGRRHKVETDKRDAGQQADLQASLEGHAADLEKHTAGIEKWAAEGRAMTPDQQAAAAHQHQAEIEAEKQKNNQDAAKDWADYLAKKAGLPNLSDRLKGLLAGAKDFLEKGPALPAIPDIQKAASDGMDGVAKKLGAVGTFNARVAGMLAGGSHAANIDKNTAQLVDIGKKTNQAIDNLAHPTFTN
jgi:hypothetical protein